MWVAISPPGPFSGGKGALGLPNPRDWVFFLNFYSLKFDFLKKILTYFFSISSLNIWLIIIWAT